MRIGVEGGDNELQKQLSRGQSSEGEGQLLLPKAAGPPLARDAVMMMPFPKLTYGGI